MELRRGSLFANLLTLGNGICGFAALVKLSEIQVIDGALHNGENLVFAGYLILLGMLFDVFDGKVARMVKGATELGAQLDSLCDLVTFGLVPAFMIVQMNLALADQEPFWGNMVWFFSLAYFLGALLRLARFNVENSPDEDAHLCFKGLPSPAAAGCVASLVIFQGYVQGAPVSSLLKAEQAELRWLSGYFPKVFEGVTYFGGAINYVLPLLAVILGFTMVSSRLKFEHIGSRILGKSHSWEFFVTLIFAALFLAIVPEIFLPLAFIGYLVWTPVMFIIRLVFGGRGAPKVDEEEPQTLQRS